MLFQEFKVVLTVISLCAFDNLLSDHSPLKHIMMKRSQIYIVV